MEHDFLVRLGGIGSQGQRAGRDDHAVGLTLGERRGTEGDEESVVVGGHLLETDGVAHRVALAVLEDGTRVASQYLDALVEAQGHLLHGVEGSRLGRCRGVVLQQVDALADVGHLLGHAYDVAFTLRTYHGSQHRTVGRAGPHGTRVVQSRSLAEVDAVALGEDEAEGVPDIVVHHLPLAQRSAGG